MSYKFKTACLSFSLMAISLLKWLPSPAQKKAVPPPSPYNFEAVDQLFKQNQKSLGNNFVALIWKDGKVVYQNAGSPDFTAKMQAPIGGAGNWMTAALVMTFVDEGKLSLDDKVSKYIPLFTTYSKGYITIRNCLTNTSGVQGDAEGFGKMMQKSKFESLEDAVNSYASKRRIISNPGTEFLPNSVGPDIAARVLEIIGKKGFDRLMQERIIRPLKMRSTSFSNEEGGAVDPSGGARSSANDYINFLVMLMNNGEFEGKRVLSEKAVKEMETAQFGSLAAKGVPVTLAAAHYGLGAWIMQSGPDGSAQVLSAPNLLGTAPFIDKCRGYAAILIVLKPEEEKKNLAQSMKGLIDQAIGGGCN
ncbi:MAG TPA: serine hydrolase [Puia sp.]|nr:serine hydrolase [Puia sp.]